MSNHSTTSFQAAEQESQRLAAAGTSASVWMDPSRATADSLNVFLALPCGEDPGGQWARVATYLCAADRGES